MAKDEWFDPRLTVFVIWGIFVVLFIVVPEPARRAEDLRLDGMPLLRVRGGGSALEHRWTLEEKDMLRRASSTPGERKAKKRRSKTQTYTHISIPQPGHNAECVDVHELMARAEAEKKEAETKPKKEKKKPRIRLFGGKAVKEEAKDVEGDKEDIKTLGDAEVKKGRRRSCPLFCAICLQQYEPSERVSWSSNPECTHAFHEDCVVQWLVSLGRTKAKRQRFSDDPTEAQLLNYELECPCCRQEFISRGQAELPEVCGEERV
ncbi:hypothetical protein ACHAXT_009884 [Thalassiosira profunda]